jgi:hypothetical protein
MRRWFVPAVPLALAILLLFHPTGSGDRIYDALADDVTRWLVVHVGIAILAGLLALATYLLLDGVSGRAATISRWALGPFVVFFIAWESTLGIGTGVLVDHANGLPPGRRAVVADAIQEYFASPLIGDPSVLGTLGNLAWIVVVVAAAVAFRRAGAGWAVSVLIGLGSLFVFHAIPVGAAGLVCFAIGAALVERARAQPAGRRAEATAPPDVAPAGT